MKRQIDYPVISYLENNLLRTIETDIVAVLAFHEQQQIGGFHSIPREVFCYVDFLGSIFKGPPATSEKAISFIQTYMVKVDQRYTQVDKLIYEMWRHGTVHEFDPKRLKHSRKKYSIGWLTNNDATPAERACHLECFRVKNTQNRYVIALNLFELVDHLKLAINEFIAQLKQRRILAVSTQKHFDEISKLMTVKNLRVGKTKKRQLNLQISGAVNRQRREIDEKGNVV